MTNIFRRRPAYHKKDSRASLSKSVAAFAAGVITFASIGPALADDWPAVPVSEAAPSRPKIDKSAAPLPKVQSLLPTEPPYDLFQKGAPPAQIRGTLVYTPLLYHMPGSFQYIVLRGFGLTRNIEGQPTEVAAYNAMYSPLLFDPQFSADGKRILVKSGAPFESYGNYSLYLWDTVAGRLREVLEHNEVINFNDLFWSPDSNYIGYVRGGNMAGKEEHRMGQIHLRILDLQKGKSRRVVKNRGTTDMAWTHQGTLLFTMLPKKPNAPKEEEREQDKAEGPEPEAPVVPSIYEVPAKSGAPKRIIENGYNPAPSPDGKWIAFLNRPAAAGKADPKDADATVAPPDLYLYNRSSKERTLVNTGNADFLLWTPDSRSLFVIKTAYMGVAGGGGKGEAYISVIDPVTLNIKQVATLEGYDYRPMPGRNITSRLFTPLKFSRDGKFLFVRVEEITGAGADSSFNAVRKTLQAVDLTSGNVAVIAEFRDNAARVLGFDWYDETGTATTSVSSVTTVTKRR